MVYFKSEAQRNEWEELAANDNAPRFSRWILDKADLGISGTSTELEILEEYRSRIDSLQTAVEYERSVANEYREEVRALTQKMESYADLFATLAKEKLAK
jgi:hypothetical protein